MLAVENVSFTLPSPISRTLLNKVQLFIPQGQCVAIVGENGAGKSTFLNMISGVQKPSSGRLWLDGQDITSWSSTRRASVMATVMQDPKIGTLEEMTIFENMIFALKRGQRRYPLPFATAKRRQFCQDRLQSFNMGLEHRLDEIVGRLSGGQRQILSLGMAILQDSKVLLLDEMTAALDPSSSQTLMTFTQDLLQKECKTCVMVTHNMHHALRYADRILILKEGRLIKDYEGEEKKQLTFLDLMAFFDSSSEQDRERWP